MRTIEVTVSPRGETKIETKGFAGSACKDATKALQAALGQTESDVATAEMYAAAQATATQQHRG